MIDPADYAVAVKVDRAPVIGLEAPVLEVGVQVNHASMRGAGVLLDVASHASDVILELSSRGPEGVADGDVGVLVSSVFLRGAGDHQVVTGNADLDPDVVVPSLVGMVVRHLDEHTAADYAIEDGLELVHPTANIVLDRRVGRHLVECDL